jgi:hypothetical protein
MKIYGSCNNIVSEKELRNDDYIEIILKNNNPLGIQSIVGIIGNIRFDSKGEIKLINIMSRDNEEKITGYTIKSEYVKEIYCNFYLGVE